MVGALNIVSFESRNGFYFFANTFLSYTNQILHNQHFENNRSYERRKRTTKWRSALRSKSAIWHTMFYIMKTVKLFCHKRKLLLQLQSN